jgi:hypothetical protein
MNSQQELRQQDNRKPYDTPELSRLGDVENITQDHAGITCKDLPLGSSDDIKSDTCG